MAVNGYAAQYPSLDLLVELRIFFALLFCVDVSALDGFSFLGGRFAFKSLH